MAMLAMSEWVAGVLVVTGFLVLVALPGFPGLVLRFFSRRRAGEHRRGSFLRPLVGTLLVVPFTVFLIWMEPGEPGFMPDMIGNAFIALVAFSIILAIWGGEKQ